MRLFYVAVVATFSMYSSYDFVGVSKGNQMLLIDMQVDNPGQSPDCACA